MIKKSPRTISTYELGLQVSYSICTQIQKKSYIWETERFEFIHPFRDGNGSMGRYWQTALIASWKPIFEYISIESIINDNHEEYYKAIKILTSQRESNAFIEFMIDVILKAIADIANDTTEHYNHLSINVNKFMQVLAIYPQIVRELMNKLGLKFREGSRKKLYPAIATDLIGMIIPDKPTSKSEMYFKLN